MSRLTARNAYRRPCTSFSRASSLERLPRMNRRGLRMHRIAVVVALQDDWGGIVLQINLGPSNPDLLGHLRQLFATERGSNPIPRQQTEFKAPRGSIQYTGLQQPDRSTPHCFVTLGAASLKSGGWSHLPRRVPGIQTSPTYPGCGRSPGGCEGGCPRHEEEVTKSSSPLRAPRPAIGVRDVFFSFGAG